MKLDDHLPTHLIASLPFPDEWKIARGSSVFNGQRNLPKYYRPLSTSRYFFVPVIIEVVERMWSTAEFVNWSLKTLAFSNKRCVKFRPKEM